MSTEIIEQLTFNQIQELYHLYQLEWWSEGRQLPDIQRMIDNSDITIGICNPDSKELIGFVRVLTDYVYKALILDVIVKKTYRNKQLGRILMDKIVHHPSLKNVKHFELYCLPDMIPFYEKWGFTDKLGTLEFMRKITP